MSRRSGLTSSAENRPRRAPPSPPLSGTTRRTPALALAFLISALAAPAYAAPKDGSVQKTLKQAMEDDYLVTEFDAAEKKLRGALDTCGESGCSPAVKAKVYVGLGIVLIGGKGKKDDGKQAFADALKLDPSVTPDPDYVTADIKAAFEDAKKSAGSGGGGSSGSSGGDDGLTLADVPQQKVNTPVPIYVTVEDDLVKKVATVVLTYVPVKGSESKTLELEKSGRAFRANIPCGAVAKKGTLKYWAVAKDKKDKVVAKLGSEADPLTTAIKADTDGKPPSWPGFAPPEPCAASSDGGGDGGEDGADTSGSTHRQCVDDKDCPSDERCAVNECLKKPKSDGGGDGQGGGGGTGGGDAGGGDDDPAKKARLNWIRLTFAPDFAMISGEHVCGFSDAYAGGTPKQENASDTSYVCVRNPEGENHSRYLGKATDGQGNNVNFGFGVSTMRLMLSYDRVLIKGLSIGARLGWAFNGTNEEFASFIPVHAEGRLNYTIGKDPFAGQVVRPWVGISGGLAQVDTAVNVDVLEDGEACGAAGSSDPCTIETSDGVIEPRLQTLRAIKQAGLGFAGATVGVSFVPVDLFEINLGVRFSLTIPVVIPVFSPELGIGFGF